MSLNFEIPGLEAHLRLIVREEIERAQNGSAGWLDTKGAAEHLATTAEAIRMKVKASKLPVHRTPDRRLLFRADELDQWVLGGEVSP